MIRHHVWMNEWDECLSRPADPVDTRREGRKAKSHLTHDRDRRLRLIRPLFCFFFRFALIFFGVYVSLSLADLFCPTMMEEQ